MNSIPDLERMLLTSTPLGFARLLSSFSQAELDAICRYLRLTPPPEAKQVDLVGLITDFLHPNGQRVPYDFLDRFRPT